MPTPCLSTANKSIDLSLTGTPAQLAAEVHLAREAGQLLELRPGGSGGSAGLMAVDKATQMTRGPGVVGYDDFRITPPPAPALAVAITTLGTAAHPPMAFLEGTADLGPGYGSGGSPKGGIPVVGISGNVIPYIVNLNAADTTRPRIDTIVLVATWDAVNQRMTGVILVQTGTPTAGATLDNRIGAPTPTDDGNISTNLLHLADVIVNAGATAIDASMIRDRRRFAVAGATPGYGSDQSVLVPRGCQVSSVAIGSGWSGYQSAALFECTKRVQATYMRFRYQQGTTPCTAAYVLALYDASRRVKFAASASFHGAASQWVTETLAVNYGRIEPGLYYVLFGVGTITAGQTVWVRGPHPAIDMSAGLFGPDTYGCAFGLAGGGNTAPTTLAGLFDTAAIAAASTVPPVPTLTLAAG